MTFILMVLALITEAFIVIYAHPQILLPVAILVSSCFLIVRAMSIFFHGPCMKQISNQLTGYEGRFESAPQFLIHLVLLMTEHAQANSVDWLEIYGLCSSLVMLAKDLAENILMSLQNNTWFEKSFSAKIYMMGRIIPAIILTAIFRLGTLALAIHHIFVVGIGIYVVPLKLTILLPPAATILIARRFSSDLHDLSVTDCFVGIIEELSTFAIWKNLQPKGRRRIRLGFMIYFGLLYGSYCLWTVFNPPSPHVDLYAIVFLCCGWMAFPLYVRNIFFIDSDKEIREESRDTYNRNPDNGTFKMDGVDFNISYI